MVHEIPVDSDSETRLFIIFSLRALATTAIALVVGGLVGFLLKLVGLKTAVIWSLGIFGLLGFLVGTFKIPKIGAIPVTKDASDLYLHEALIRYFQFKKRRKMYVLSKGE